MAGGLAASVLGVAGLGGAEARPQCRDQGDPCEGNQTCCDGLVCVASGPGNARRCTPCPAGQIACAGTCIPACTASDACHVAGVCDPKTGACTNPPAPAGTACNDGNACTLTDTCQAGACVGSNPVVCTASDRCHVAGTCDPATGNCSNPNAPDGTACDDGDACTQKDTCQAGVCVGSNPVVCKALDQCHVAGTCNSATGVCDNPNASEDTACDDRNACTQKDTCDGKGHCVGHDPVQCAAPGPCQESVACDQATGGCVYVDKPEGTLCGADGACVHDVCDGRGTCLKDEPKKEGTSCSDDNDCTESDACDGRGNCVGGKEVTCPPADACHDAGTCNPKTGRCGDNPISAGTCFIDGRCYKAGDPNPGNACQLCDPAQSQIAFSNTTDGTACDDGDLCTVNDTCQQGGCAAGDPVLCLSIYTCHERSFCDPGTGQCIHEDKPDGEPCNDGNGCTTGEVCAGGVCGGGEPVVCEGDGNPCMTPPSCISFGGGFGGCTDLFREPVANGTSCGDNGEFCCHGNCCDGGEVCSLGLVCAACKDILDTCATDDQCCSGICDPNLKLCVCETAGLLCSENRNCCGVTNPGCCNQTCVDLNIDLFHCGGCNNPVPLGGVCYNGVPSCLNIGNTYAVCDNTCVDTDVDLHHCGRCNHACNIGSEVCSLGHCCPVGFEWTGTRCCPIGFHEDGGICCSAGFHASNGLCCAVGMTNCGGTCVNTSVDLNHCGQCFRKAPIGGVCLGGVPQCSPGLYNDNGRCCFNTERNCGGCCSIFAKTVCPC